MDLGKQGSHAACTVHGIGAFTSCPSCLIPAERVDTINAAIASVKESTKTVSQSYIPSHRTQNRIESEEFDGRGRARIMFEKAVRKAETELMKLHYKNDLESTDRNVKAEALAKVALHRPGSFLTKEEIAHIQQETMAECYERSIPDCSSWEVMKYRTIDGTCNNPERPTLAAAGTDFRRIVPSHYEDGCQRPRGTLQRLNMSLLHEGPFDPPIPSAREASRTILLDRPTNDEIHSHMIMQWGQFLDHDLDLAPEQEECPMKSCEITEKCSPIAIVQDPDGDPTFGSIPCMSFARSIPSCEVQKGEITPREQFNALTHYIDASNVYGSTNEVARALRESDGGRLLVGPPHASGAKPSLPLFTHEQLQASPVCLTSCPCNMTCYVAGDTRVNEHMSLTVMHTIWMREHNRIVAELAKLDSTLTDEELYQTARKIIGGVMQKIVFEEYLTEVLGSATVERFILGGYRRFEQSVDPRIPNAYATAAFRYGHSLIRPDFARLGSGYRSINGGPLNLLDSFFNPRQYNRSEGTDPILRGLLTQHAMRSDEFLDPVITNDLFRTADKLGRDLGALNINRGRDHGLAPYPVWREYCIKYYQEELGINVTIEFRSQLTELHLLRTYGSLDSVDLFPGGMAEAPFTYDGTSSIIGPTFTCIFINTYRVLSRGDRFFYLGDTAFTDEQRAEVRKSSLSRVICDNSDSIQSIQANAFTIPTTTSNPRVPCSSLPALNPAAFVPLGQCRQTTFMKVTAVGKVTVALAAPTDTMRFRLRRDAHFIHFKTESKCIQIRCPETFVRLLAIGFSCRTPVQAPGLPGSVSRWRAYDAKISADLLVAANGFYSSQKACQRGSASALTIRRRIYVQETEVEHQTIDDEEIFKQLNRTYHSGEYMEMQDTSHDLGISEEEREESLIEANADQDALLQSLEEALHGLEN